PPSEELDTTQWAQHFQPVVQHPAHRGSVWAKVQERPNTVILVTLWQTTSALRDFLVSPSAQLYWENLAARGILPIASYEVVYGWEDWFNFLSTSFVQLFSVYFSAPMTEVQRAQISQLKGIRPPIMGFSIPHRELDQSRLSVQLWATQTESRYGQEVQLMLWPHFWQSEKKAEYRNSYTDIIEYGCVVGYRTMIEDFGAKLEEVGPVKWKEEYCDFKKFRPI
ncbi:uncharacterized protein N7498_002813, partial [Penicillium cinerascens]